MDAKGIFEKVDMNSRETILRQTIQLIINQKQDEIWELRNAGAKNFPIQFWENDIHAFYKANKEQIAELETKRLLNNYSKETLDGEYLVSKITDTLLMQTPLTPDKKGAVLDNLQKQGMKLTKTMLSVTVSCVVMKNMRIEYYVDKYHNKERWELKVNGLTKYLIEADIYPAEVYIEIDNRIPHWLAESQTLQRECCKREKIERINSSYIKALVQNKMRELNCEYRFYEKEQNGYWNQNKPKEFVLDIKLQKSKKLNEMVPANKSIGRVRNALDGYYLYLSVVLSANNIDSVKKTLDELSTTISATNNVLKNVRISYGNGQWVKEKVENQ